MSEEPINLFDHRPDLTVRLQKNDSTGNVYAVWYAKDGTMIAYYNVTKDYMELRAAEREKK